MPKYTKTQKRRAAETMVVKSDVLFMQNLISANDREAVVKIASKALKKLGY